MKKDIQKYKSSLPKKLGKEDISKLLKSMTKTKMKDQLCLLVLDGSMSMNNLIENNKTKAKATEEALNELVEILTKSANSSWFHLAVITYGAEPELCLPSQLVDKISKNDITLGDLFGKGKSTRIDKALQYAERLATAFLNSAERNKLLERDVRIVLMSDGLCHMPKSTIEIAQKIKSDYSDTIRICTSLLGKNEDSNICEAESLMKEIASKDENDQPFYTRSYNALDLRSFFERSTTTL